MRPFHCLPVYPRKTSAHTQICGRQTASVCDSGLLNGVGLWLLDSTSLPTCKLRTLQANGISVSGGGAGGGLLKGVGRWLDRGINRLIGGDSPAPGASSDDEPSGGAAPAAHHRRRATADARAPLVTFLTLIICYLFGACSVSAAVCPAPALQQCSCCCWGHGGQSLSCCSGVKSDLRV